MGGPQAGVSARPCLWMTMDPQITIFNTLGRRLTPLKPIEPGVVVQDVPAGI